MLSDEARKLYCIDWESEGDMISLYGDRSDDSYQRLDIIVAPCNYLNTEFGHEGDTIIDECIADLDA